MRGRAEEFLVEGASLRIVARREEYVDIMARWMMVMMMMVRMRMMRMMMMRMMRMTRMRMMMMMMS